MCFHSNHLTFPLPLLVADRKGAEGKVRAATVLRSTGTATGMEPYALPASVPRTILALPCRASSKA